MISCVGAAAAAMRLAMPTRAEWPEKPDPRPAAAAAARMRRAIEDADSPNIDADPSASAGRIASRAATDGRRQVDGARLGVGLRAAHAQPARAVLPMRRVVPDQRGRLAAAPARVRQHAAQRDIDQPAAPRLFRRLRPAASSHARLAGGGEDSSRGVMAVVKRHR